MSNRKDIHQKTDFNTWSISYLTQIFQCSKCKKRNTIIMKNNEEKNAPLYQHCNYCVNPKYISKK